MRAITESEIESDVLRHDARNLQLKRRLAERGVHFRGNAPSSVISGLPTRGKSLGWNKRLSREDFWC